MDDGRRPIPAPVPGNAAATREVLAAERRRPSGTGADEERSTRVMETVLRIPESMLMEWTDEKHNLYLNSMEASFINQLYSTDYGSRNIFGWRPTMTQKDMHAYGSSSNYMLYGQAFFYLLQNLAEVSDQNFVDMGPEAENLSQSIRRKRAKK
ncbi:hypothetical protein BHE74_00016649 [Ensete ventricosum]|uniref:Uncharacterized protein n=1 Tax=Ensete ventricosum TaxID=4639 RepID=A0A427ARC3_ENSVE|nr:hypothetical protein B296_00026586 [Ensete ventricosum]RWW75335.1 hypothetical protein BHE74_00016649 [Ensete ventricosum]RZR95813.1 hypothetical protein BHM03_00024703 [Ensete ventricosum]